VKLLNKSQEAIPLFYSMRETSDALAGFSSEDVRALNPIGLSEELGAVILPYVSGRRLAHMLQEERFISRHGREKAFEYITRCGSILASYHEHFEDNQRTKIDQAWRDLHYRIGKMREDTESDSES